MQGAYFPWILDISDDHLTLCFDATPMPDIEDVTFWGEIILKLMDVPDNEAKGVAEIFWKIFNEQGQSEGVRYLQGVIPKFLGMLENDIQERLTQALQDSLLKLQLAELKLLQEDILMEFRELKAGQVFMLGRQKAAKVVLEHDYIMLSISGIGYTIENGIYIASLQIYYINAAAYRDSAPGSSIGDGGDIAYHSTTDNADITARKQLNDANNIALLYSLNYIETGSDVYWEDDGSGVHYAHKARLPYAQWCQLRPALKDANGQWQDGVYGFGGGFQPGEMEGFDAPLQRIPGTPDYFSAEYHEFFATGAEIPNFYRFMVKPPATVQQAYVETYSHHTYSCWLVSERLSIRAKFRGTTPKPGGGNIPVILGGGFLPPLTTPGASVMGLRLHVNPANIGVQVGTDFIEIGDDRIVFL